MRINWTISGLTKKGYIILYIILVGVLFYYSWAAYNKSWNADRRMGVCLALKSGDEASYLDDMEKFIQTGEYGTLDLVDKNVGRGPYYAIPYFIFRQLLSPQYAYDAMVILHILCFALAIIMLMKLAEMCIYYKSMVWLIPICIIGIPLSMCFLSRIQTEMLTLTELVLFAFFYFKFNQKHKLKHLGLAALFLSLAAVIKPYLLPIFAICFFDWTISNKVVNVKCWMRYIGIMSLPLVIICAPFTIRNAVKLHTFAPMQNTTYAGSKNDPVDAAMRKMVRTWGEFHIEWNEKALGTFFLPVEGYHFSGNLPKHIYVEGYSEEDIYRLRDQCLKYLHMPNCAERDYLMENIVTTMNGYTSLYREAHPFWRLRAMVVQGKFLLSKGTFSINHRHSGIRAFISNGLCFLKFIGGWFVLILGLIGLLLIANKEKKLRFISWIVLYIIALFVVLLSGESRFYMLGDYYGLIGVVFLLDQIFTSRKLKNKHESGNQYYRPDIQG